MADFTSKRELIYIHTLLLRVKEMLELLGISNEFFSAYDDLGVLPTHIFRRKEEHKRAVMLLCFGVMRAMGEDKIHLNWGMDLLSPTLVHD